MKSRSFVVPIVLLLVVGGLIVGLQFMKQNKESRIAIGIIQTASHPALDAIYDGFVAEINEKFDSPPKIIWQNTQGTMSEAQAIAQSFHSNEDIKLILSIATPAAQAMVNKEKDKPIILTAVTDASVLDASPSQKNICGLEDRIDIDKMMALISTIMPNTKSAGIIYNPSEANSISLAKIMEKALKGKGLDAIHIGVYHEQEITQALTSASRKVDFFLAPTDNMVAMSIDRIVGLTDQLGKPFIASDVLLTKKGATAACGVDYKKAGRFAGQVAYEILKNGKQPIDLGIKQTPSFIVQNKKRSEKLRLPLIANVMIIDQEEE